MKAFTTLRKFRVFRKQCNSLQVSMQVSKTIQVFRFSEEKSLGREIFDVIEEFSSLIRKSLASNHSNIDFTL